MSAPINRRPTADEIREARTFRQRGYAYRVQVFHRPIGTDEIEVSHVTVRTSRLINYQDVIDEVVDAFAGMEENYEDEILGAIPTDVVFLIPLQS